MKVYRNILPSRWLVAAILVGASQDWIAQHSAQARCGDYVMLGGHGAQYSLPATESTRSGALLFEMPGSNHPVIDDGPLHNGRCSGPLCSNDDSRPLGGPTVPAESEVRQWGLVAVEWLEATVVPQLVRISDDLLQPHFAV